MEEGVTKSAGISLNGKRSVFDRVNFKQQITPRVPLDTNGPRPTRIHEFKWKNSTKTLRITKIEGGKRVSQWVPNQPITTPFEKVIGPTNTQTNSWPTMTTDELTKPSTQLRSTVEAEAAVGQPSFFACLDSVFENGESSREDHMAPASPLATTHGVSEPLDRWRYDYQASESPASPIGVSDDFDTNSTPAPANPGLPLVLFSDTTTDVVPNTEEPIQTIVAELKDVCFESED
jgi:hypothetical protein